MIRTGLTLDQVAHALGVTREWFYRNHRRLAREHGFPSPMPGMARLYDPRAIALWQDAALERQGLTPKLAAPPAPASAGGEGEGTEPDPWAGILDRRAEALAGGPS